MCPYCGLVNNNSDIIEQKDIKIQEIEQKIAPFTIYEAINLIKNDWNYKGLFTIEPEKGLNETSWEDLVKAIS